jgi:O-acetyl-ADP-ribose deacetylase (regulator of RNase III)
MPERVGRMTFPGGQVGADRVFEAVRGDLLAEPVDAIFNAANGMLAHGGGVAAAIARAAGPELEREGDAIVKAQGRVPVGGAVVTTAGRLPFKGVVHVVGPHQGEGDEEDKLVRALKAGFAAASERGWTSVAFPAVSSGIFAVPAPVCARAYVRAVREFFAEQEASPLKTVRLALFGGPIVDAVRAAME